MTTAEKRRDGRALGALLRPEVAPMNYNRPDWATHVCWYNK